MTWTPPDQGFPPSKPQGPARLSWRLGHSAWVLLPILSFGCLSAAGFLYVGVRARRHAWSIAGIVYSVLANAAFFTGPTLPKDGVASDLTVVALLIVWMISVVHALVINSSWLQWRAGHQPWYAQQTAAPWAGVPAPGPVPPQVQGLVPPPSQYYGAQPSTPQPYAAPPQASAAQQAHAAPYAPMAPQSPFAPPAPPVPDVPSAPPASSARLEVNNATVAQLAMLPGVGPERAERAVAARDSRGGFASLAEFADAASLAPHEFVAVRDHLTCAPPPAPQHDHDQPFGRIVDV
ncbi:helix-hairpin-helix domain-containing protein [Actinoplanes flavus]|uniref:Helix-hairpin-helix domain-containing protein n=1 Tax=Actinoplanes flavus TaxID=2820290 RepID=A0ABS3UKK1_9ACTN|nr:helix-hairpin-helix domain-containing protein [Actinoplanes flavus]MBO3739320.1 helix-hairpin-helix domain-containing protein [Actinoplanes flavus]